jgi:hypothetical protein
MSCVLQLELATGSEVEFDLPEIGWPKLVQGTDLYAQSNPPAVESDLLKSASSQLLDTLQI